MEETRIKKKKKKKKARNIHRPMTGGITTKFIV